MDNKSWDSLAADYDKSVEDNQNPLIINYLKKEIEILNTLCQKHSDSHKNFSIIDIGSFSIRLVVYDSLSIVSRTLFNEKVICNLGRKVNVSGNIDSNTIN